MKRNVSRVFLTFATALAFLASVYAADTKPAADPELILVTVVKIKPGMAKQWEEVQGQITNAFQKSGARFRAVWQNHTIGDLSTYATATPLSKFADLDGESPYVTNVPKEQREKNSEILSQSTLEIKRIVLRSRPDLSIGQRNSLPATPVQLVRIQIAPGRQIDYETILKNEFIPAAKKGGMEVATTYQVVMGDRTPQYHVVVGMNKFADFDGPSPIVKALGKPAADKLGMKFAGITMGSESSVMRIRPDISFMMKADKGASAGE